MEWELQAKPDGPLLKFRGTIEEVWDELHKINPDYDHDF